ncbi:hypothetical protein [Mycolicibacterium sp.]|uniref:hypothetical protein n=1 Tax=Mycolicibacterium sp. TaxID=2320850 RepID=UPI001A28B331|nr:hypothetical protein [Mycolicibacterium sp.]MBJ7340972.1 hypothetical protein [Mycolicibacterium sp.]
MTAARVQDVGPAVAADVMQAAYFRATLSDERDHINARLSKHRGLLAQRSGGGSMSGLAHLTSQVRALEAELRYLDGLIASLDRRFASLRS